MSTDRIPLCRIEFVDPIQCPTPTPGIYGTAEKIYETRKMRTSDIMRGRSHVALFISADLRFVYLVEEVHGNEIEVPIHRVHLLERTSARQIAEASAQERMSSVLDDDEPKVPAKAPEPTPKAPKAPQPRQAL